jgi:hypothetical protein
MKCSICEEEVSTCIIRTDPKADRRPRCLNCAGIQTSEPPFPVHSKSTPVSSDPNICVRHNCELVWSTLLKNYVCVDCIIESSERETGEFQRLKQNINEKIKKNISFADWLNAHQCYGCPTYEKYKGNPFGEHCATCVRHGCVTDNYGKE